MEKEFINIINKNQGIIHKVCRMYLESEEERKDLFQEILLQLWRSYPKFREESKISTWMYRVALNTAISSFKKKKRNPQKQGLSPNLEEIADKPYSFEYEEKLKVLYQAIEKLSKVEKAIVMLYFEDYSTEDIGEIVGITANNVRVKMNRIKGKLQKIVNPKPTKA